VLALYSDTQSLATSLSLFLNLALFTCMLCFPHREVTQQADDVILAPIHFALALLCLAMSRRTSMALRWRMLEKPQRRPSSDRARCHRQAIFSLII
jgi:hypothetical protein